ncbi:MAG: galactose ABC transporter substrate-binding protein, partial [bacterium]|nr:galactose ABC transporter substrate-binding protein [bacterium]
MKRKITGIIIMAIFVGTLIFSTCSKKQPATDNQIYIGVACYDQKDTFIGELVDAFKEQCS